MDIHMQLDRLAVAGQASIEGSSSAAVWAMGLCGVLADIATVAQLSGLHAIMLIALAARLLRIPQCKMECAKLEECARKLRAPLQWPTTGQEIAMQHPALAGLIIVALVEAAGLVDSYHRSTLWCCVRTGRSTEMRFREMQNRINYLRMLMLCAHANLLTQQPAVHPASP
ncbi:hypothetical protein ZWY2020_046875 [Hordeum vulgare]|nr:hypothetical protein ZWY2020_046875 [Hordeum vulgare]